MKQIIISVFSLLILSTACTKDNSGIASQGTTIRARTTTCETATITQQGLGCDLWGINVGGRVYPAFNIPDQFKVEGKIVCVSYELVEDSRDCPAPCCGGIWASITSIE